MKTPYKEACCVVDQHCRAPANLEDRPVLRTKCFSCGQAVCTMCSSRRLYGRHGKVRLCNTCQVERDGNDTVVMRRIRRLAGYKG